MEYNNQIINQMIQIDTQMNKVLLLIDSEESINDVISQLRFVRKTLDELSVFIVTTNLATCIESKRSGHENELFVKEAITLMIRSR